MLTFNDTCIYVGNCTNSEELSSSFMIQLYYHTWSKFLPQLQPLRYITCGYCTITCSGCYKSCLWTHFVCTCRSMQGENMSDIMDYVIEILIKVSKDDGRS